MAALTRMRKAWRPVLIGALVLAGMASTATPASAASTNRTGLCNKTSSYSSYLKFPNRGGFTSPAVRGGQCWSITLAAGSTEPVYVYAYRNGVNVYIGWRSISTGQHNVFRTYGTFTSPSFTLSVS
ncbi:hypothetical protein [Micromonospora sp. NPDC048830]|uniref:hypothetical protein n=1 Tax=Micromonospora sp. NPDC048830 TaxID=3364257 RepID=UPI0037122AF4